MKSIFRRAPKEALAILGFHNITPTFSQPFLSSDFPRRFRGLCRLLRRRFEPVTVTEGFRRLSAGERPRRPLLALIFDDGYADMHDTIMPILREEGVKGTSYVITDCLETGRVPWYEELGRLVYRTKNSSLEFVIEESEERFPLPSDPRQRHAVFWDLTRRLKTSFDDRTRVELERRLSEHDLAPHDPGQEPMMLDIPRARALLAAGIEVGCHSKSHPILPSLADKELELEIVSSKTRLADLIAHEVTSFCYPNGDNDARCVARAQSAGYDCAVSMACGANLASNWEPHRLKRAAMSEEITAIWPWHTAYRVHAALVEEAAK